MKMKFADELEEVVKREEMPLSVVREILSGEVIGILGYGPQAQGQGLNLLDNGFSDTIIGVRKGRSFDKALADGWKEGVNLFSAEEAAERGTIVKYLLSDAAQKENWEKIKPHLHEGDALYFSHGFSIVFNHLTGVVPPDYVDTIMVAPKGSGKSLRDDFVNKKGINSSYAVHHDHTGRATKRTQALGMAIGSGYLFETTFEKEVYSDLTGERCVLMGLIQGAFSAQFEVLRKMGHSTSEAYNETCEEFHRSLSPLTAENGMDWMYENCSTTAQRGALDWSKKFNSVLKPVIQSCYDSVKSGREAEIVLAANSDPQYREKLGVELADLKNSELWRAGVGVRALRAENQK